ncbi:unnamed protein product [Cuscuta epithymum]|uniref:RRM domain-containing protein n=1 Tax=Cuscuta epithymum TaxID=186058 RepID=A0AAV0E2D1_9ASTE|nr:unnamed protein product [Cuscuta epithymum]
MIFTRLFFQHFDHTTTENSAQSSLLKNSKRSSHDFRLDVSLVDNSPSPVVLGSLLKMSAVGSSLSHYTYPNGTYFPTPFHLQQQQPQAYIGPASLPPVQVPVPSVVPTVYPVTAPLPSTSLSQYQQANQLFQRVAQIVTPEAIENVKAALASSEIEQKADAKKKAVHRKAAGQTWEDPTLADWPENDYRLFCGDLGNEVNDDVLSKAFSRFRSFNMARVVRDKRTGKTKGYGFVSFSNPSDLAAALKEINERKVFHS